MAGAPRPGAPRDQALARLIVGATLAVLVVPVLVDLIVSGRRRVFAYLAADAFYYLQVAVNITQHHSVSFDGTHATNGFQPLWQGVVAGEQAVSSALGLGRTPMLYLVVLTGLVVLAAAVVLLAGALRAAHGRLSPLFVGLPLGAYAVLFAPLWVYSGALRTSGINPAEGPMPLYGTLWSYANGMETPVVIGAFALVAFFLARRPIRSRRAGAILGALLSLVVLARIDTIFVVAGVLAVLGISAWAQRDWQGLRSAGVAVAVLGIVVFAYLLTNRLYSDSWLPVSGTIKSSFPRPTLGNWRDLRLLISDPTFLGPSRWYRQFPTVFCALVAAVFLLTARVPTVLRTSLGTARARYRALLVGTAAGVIALSAYDFFFVPNYNQGHWYYPLSTLFVSLAVLEWVSGVRLGAHGRLRAGALRAGVTAAVCVVVSAVVFVTLGRRVDYHRRFADFYYDGAPSLVASYRGHPPPLLEVDDGIDLYSLGAEGISGIGPMLDHAGVQALDSDRLLQLAVSRGFDRIVSLNYLDATGLTDQTPSDVLRDRVEHLLQRPGHPPPDLSGYDFSVERRLPPGLIAPDAPGNDGSYVVILVRRRG